MDPRIYPPLPGSTPLYCDYVNCIRLPESTPPSQNRPHFLTTICDPPRIYDYLPEHTPPPFNNYMRPSQNLLLSPRIYPPFQQLYATLPESTPPSQNPPLLSTTIILCDPPMATPSLPEYTPLSQLHATHPESTPPSQNIPPFLYKENYKIMRPSQNIFQFWERVIDSLTSTCSL